MIHPIVQLLYYMFLNKGKVGKGCVATRMHLLPITITDAQSTIEALCRELERDMGVAPNTITVNEITTKDFEHFYRDPKTNSKPQRNFKPIPVKHKMTGPFRRTK